MGNATDAPKSNPSLAFGDDTYTCNVCKGTFEKGWDDADALKEQKLIFGFNPPPEEQGVVCDDCFNAIMGRRAARIGGKA